VGEKFMNTVLAVELVVGNEPPVMLGLYANWNAVHKDYPQNHFVRDTGDMAPYWISNKASHILRVIEWTVYD
jgi:hypothetical protein